MRHKPSSVFAAADVLSAAGAVELTSHTALSAGLDFWRGG